MMAFSPQSSKMVNNKRKGEEFTLLSSLQNVVAVHPSSQNKGNSSDPWDECNTMLHKMLQSYDTTDNNDDELLEEISAIRNLPNQFENECHSYLLKNGEAMKSDLQQQIEAEKDKLKNTENELTSLQGIIAQLQEDNHRVGNELKSYQEQEDQIKNEIMTVQKDVEKKLRELEQFQVVCKQKVPRLRQQLSLYANFTGIKWDYRKERILAGQITIPSTHQIKYFEIDPSDMTRYEVARKLWDLVDGKDDYVVSQ